MPGKITGHLHQLMIIVYPKDPISIIPMIAFSAIIGAGVDIAGAKIVR